MNYSYRLAITTKQKALFIKATTTCQSMVDQQHFNLIPFGLHCINAIGQDGKLDVRLAKRFVREKLSKKVQFVQPNNDDMMKKVYAMAWKYMNYDANDFSSVWTKIVLPTIKSEMNLLRSRMRQRSRIESFTVKLYVLLDAHLLAID
jgi:hypothetical protein